MRRFLPAALSILLAFFGCSTFDPFQPLTTPTVVTAPPAPAVSAPRPATVQDMAAGIVEALGRGDLAQARKYYLSDEEFDALFSWAGPDPRPERNALINAALQSAAPALAGAAFKGLTEAPSKATELPQGRQILNLLLERPTSVIDGFSVVATVNGQQRIIRLEGPILVNNYWRLFSPTLNVK